MPTEFYKSEINGELASIEQPGTFDSFNEQRSFLQSQQATSQFCSKLIKAVEGDDLDEAKRLLEEARDTTGSMCTEKGKHWYSALHTAAIIGNVEAVNLLLKYNADVNSQNSWRKESPLHFAAIKGQTKVLETLLSRGASVNSVNASGSTPLHHAAREGHVAATCSLIVSGAKVNAKNAVQDTPLHEAVMNCKLDTTNILIKHGCRVNSQNSYGETSLHLALQNKHLALVKLLLLSSADPSIRNKEMKSAFELADDYEFFKELKASNATVVTKLQPPSPTPTLQLRPKTSKTSLSSTPRPTVPKETTV
ncbi:26S proteasome non-ATPase regulatory subunit 10 [Lingula anatina]|uniref:26S proteasome non-ATPase regulatory subunit 10 n=1 Tax=Lingula anatina TaxID=7574 RepID=A0A1S3GZX6_LINAN|nr:26S proteasome non-ATPase regulatory subunit 10 [Lingula anatina]|eukprot:XP_013379303.1 26S proteasome non-ATPase regulatory subunit 10 [Lingula anatina]